MKKDIQNVILIPTDFSEVCENAIEHGSVLAKAMGSIVWLLHVINKDTQKYLEDENLEESSIDDMLNKEQLMITPLAYIRGRSLSNVFFIIDEAQNLTPLEIKTIITRAGEGTKIVLTGDIEQIDSPYLDSKSNGVTYLTDRMTGEDIFAHINMTKGERSELAELASQKL
jgi:predicted ribonuclease YlaK